MSSSNKVQQTTTTWSKQTLLGPVPSVPVSISIIGIPNNVVAGYAAGVSGTLVGHPMDSLKVWMQTNRTMAHQQELFFQNNNNKNSNTASKNSIRGGAGLTASTTASSARTTPSTTSTSSSTVARLSTEKISVTSAHSSPSTSTRAISTVAMPASVEGRTATATSTACWSSSKTRVVLQSRLRALYAGVSGPLMAVGLVQSINFAIYDTTRRILYYGWDSGSSNSGSDNSSNSNNKTDYLHNDSLRNVAISSATAGSVLACFTSPMLIIKTKQQLQGISFRQAAFDTFFGGSGGSASSATSCTEQRRQRLSFLFQRGSSMYTGFGPHFVCEAFGRCIYLVSYEAMKRFFASRQQGVVDDDDKQQQHQKISLATRMFSAACAGTLGTATVYPMDVIRCRFYAQTMVPREERSKNMRQLVQTIYYQERRGGGSGGSLRNFYRGFGVTILRAGPVAAAVLPIYDMTLEALNEHSSSSSSY